jgi:hypothetical protein
MLVIIHGWSDSYDSFRALARRLAEEGLDRPIEEVHLGDYISLDDQVTFDDLTEAMQRAWLDRGLPMAPRSVDAIVHSTGALVIRDWFTRHFTPDTVPLKRLLMLAPANFGSPLAHTGRSMIGRATKGWRGTQLFETGSHILKGLELASDFSARLAERDWFAAEPWYGPGRILCTVLTGNNGYSGISAIANKPGTDGTVRVSTANLSCARLDIDFVADPMQPLYRWTDAVSGRAAFGIMDEEDHSSICAKNRGPRNAATMPAMLGALTVDDAGFQAWCERLEAANRTVMARRNAGRRAHFHGYQNTVFRVRDQYGRDVTDYLIEFYANDDRGQRARRLTRDFQETVVDNVHVYKGNPAYRSLLINCRELDRLLSRPDDRLYISITAYPEINSREVGYRTYGDGDIGALVLDHAQVRALFRENRTLLVTLTLKREQGPNVFRFHDV